MSLFHPPIDSSTDYPNDFKDSMSGVSRIDFNLFQISDNFRSQTHFKRNEKIVPPVGAVLQSTVPSMRLARDRILVRPRPVLTVPVTKGVLWSITRMSVPGDPFTLSGLNPQPSSSRRTTKSSAESISRVSFTRVADECRHALFTAS